MSNQHLTDSNLFDVNQEIDSENFAIYELTDKEIEGVAGGGLLGGLVDAAKDVGSAIGSAGTAVVGTAVGGVVGGVGDLLGADTSIYRGGRYGGKKGWGFGRFLF